MISFFHPNLNKGKPLVTRLSPTKIDWTYNLNTNIINTYGGQVVQILGINYDTLIISGMFGLEGPHGRTKKHIEPKKFWDYTNIDGNPYSIGLTQLTSYFQDYFTIATQGASAGTSTRLTGDYNQIPMIVSYSGFIHHNEGNLDTIASEHTKPGMWSVYPTNFPSYSRALEQFTPQFQITFEIEEANTHADTISTLTAISNIKDGIGFNPNAKFLMNNIPDNNTKKQFFSYTIDNIDNVFGKFLPSLGLDDINNAAVSEVSGAVTKNSALVAGYSVGGAIST